MSTDNTVEENKKTDSGILVAIYLLIYLLSLSYRVSRARPLASFQKAASLFLKSLAFRVLTWSNAPCGLKFLPLETVNQQNCLLDRQPRSSGFLF